MASPLALSIPALHQRKKPLGRDAERLSHATAGPALLRFRRIHGKADAVWLTKDYGVCSAEFMRAGLRNGTNVSALGLT
jgi:hypothetical protein